jgi:DNA-directed RNA polymerase subunit omega
LPSHTARLIKQIFDNLIDWPNIMPWIVVILFVTCVATHARHTRTDSQLKKNGCSKTWNKLPVNILTDYPMTKTTDFEAVQAQHQYEMTLGLSNEAAVSAVGNRYDLVLIGARRARELSRGDLPRLNGPKHSAVVTALKEIEQGKVGREYLFKTPDLEPRRRYKER